MLNSNYRGTDESRVPGELLAWGMSDTCLLVSIKYGKNSIEKWVLISSTGSFMRVIDLSTY